MSNTPNRLSASLEGKLFDLMYLTMNADGEAKSSEKQLIKKLRARLDRDDRVDVEARVQALEPVVSEGTDAILQHALELADDVAEEAANHTRTVADSYMTLLKGMILADDRIAEEERAIFTAVCDRWGIQDPLPGNE